VNAGLARFKLLAGLVLVELLQLAALAEHNGNLVGHLGAVLVALEHGWLVNLHWAATGVTLVVVGQQGDGSGDHGLVLAQLLLELLLVLDIEHLWAGVVAWLWWALDGGVGRSGFAVASGGQMVD